MPGKKNTDAMFALRILMEKYRKVKESYRLLCIRGPRENSRQGSERKAVVLYEKIRNSGKVCATCTGYVRGKRNSGEVCSRNYKKFQDQDGTAPRISVESVSVCCDYG